MPALKTAQPSLPYSDPLDADSEEHARPDYASSGTMPFHLASDWDDPVTSPAAEMQADLARKLQRRPRQRPRERLRFDPFWPLATLFSLVCWWGLISFGMAMLHG